MPRKPNFTPKKKRKVHGATFWDREYTNPEYLKLSERESGDLAKCVRWLIRQKHGEVLTVGNSAIDAGCGNGRNLIWLANEYKMKGFGVDISSAAIAQARRASHGLDIKYQVGSAGAPLDVEDQTQSFALDMMTSHFLTKDERTALRDELWRTLKPGGFLFMKTFLRDEDNHTERLLKDSPGPETGSYIHPIMGVPEHVYYENDLKQFLSEKFIVRQIYRSHRHKNKDGRGKRRTISVYAEKDYR